MAENAGMFGLNPYEVQQGRNAQDEERAYKMATMTAAQRGVMGLQQGGAGLGRLAGGMMGMVDPIEQKANQERALLSSADLQTPEGLRDLAKKFHGAGMPDKAFMLVTKANELDAAKQKILRENNKEDREERKLDAADRKQDFTEKEAFKFKYDQLAQALQIARERGADQKELAMMQIQGRKEIAQMMNAMRQSLARDKSAASGQKPAAGQKLTKGQEAVDRAFGKEYADYQAGGGSADVEKQLIQLQGVSDALGKKGNDYTGPYVGLVPDKARALTNAPAVAAQNKVEEVAQRNLRLVLGAQFTQVEGERLIARAYNRQMPPAENKTRVDALIKQIRVSSQTKEDAARYFEENGTLTGWRGRMPTLSDFESAIENASKKTSQSKPANSGETYEQRKARLLK